ncbi:MULTISPECIES: sensor histidine kinase [Chryseobacterium]|uniref:histidine kinase n=1 Tax=Chryseobacterium rhizosphaerae TaxID=395937 RepID=A0AAE3Y8E7_9FLAO|nr:MULTISPECIES: HAMP domain-containing sensor histidine kinase [Chryseobacterium]MBL3546789.1 HAMP domain-containing histidine kinase [Chryseobacterium sp. KMC2]MDC8102185.1 HAMP domain-containing histidine kinase [Chryseobacterium rhizosphaerae]MDR6526885.1 two-component system phosphate regulon sensor histidine kinase PhoR [Chryseobacterium rhizosphaerae]MDR6544526.1 two-component system phosphate regulon sensor histidine kinase PhoR [Chryseobacterium rhizosphaerae]REC78268.1 sensor histidi
MNNKFIPIISVFMTISLIVFVTLQFYWLKRYYGTLEQDFSNKVYSALENVSKNIEEIEADKYLNKENRKTILANSSQPSLTTIQQVEDSGTQRQIIYSKNIISNTQLPISKKGDTVKLTTLYTDEAAYKIKRDTTNRELLTADLNTDIENGDYAIKEFVKVYGSNLPIAKRVDPVILDSVISKELKIRGITAKFGYGVIDKNNKLTSIANKTYKEKKDSNTYNYPLFTDKKNTLYSLALVFPKKEYSLAMNNWPMLLGTFLSLLTILGIYIISINYMMRQKKLAEVKTDFINNMSHEFKTPLATISVATDSLANDKIATNPDKVKYYSELIKQENLRMKKQVENVLNMSKLERNEVKLFLKETNVRELIKRTTESFNLIVGQRNGSLTQKFTATHYTFKIDEFHISNMLVNLLDNANKYSPEAPEIHVETKNEGNWYVIEVSDKGMGMDTQNKTKIFEKFFREETGNIHNVKGQGLGLSYVKKIVELHKGQVIVDSNKGNGSTFTIKLPMS